MYHSRNVPIVCLYVHIFFYFLNISQCFVHTDLFHLRQMCHCYCRAILEQPEPQRVASSMHTCVSVVGGHQCVSPAHPTGQPTLTLCPWPKYPDPEYRFLVSLSLGLWWRVRLRKGQAYCLAGGGTHVTVPPPGRVDVYLGFILCMPSWPGLFPVLWNLLPNLSNACLTLFNLFFFF